jgi:hypothetical protein
MARGHLSCEAWEQEARFCSTALRIFASLPRAGPLTGTLAPISPFTYRMTGASLNAAAPQWPWHVSCHRGSCRAAAHLPFVIVSGWTHELAGGWKVCDKLATYHHSAGEEPHGRTYPATRATVF